MVPEGPFPLPEVQHVIALDSFALAGRVPGGAPVDRSHIGKGDAKAALEGLEGGGEAGLCMFPGLCAHDPEVRCGLCRELL